MLKNKIDKKIIRNVIESTRDPSHETEITF
jgi:hypothetical protein